MNVVIGLHSRMPVDVRWLNDHIKANGKCPHRDFTYDKIEVCYGNFKWDMDGFFDTVESLQQTLIEHGTPIEKTKFLVDMVKYDFPMITLLN